MIGNVRAYFEITINTYRTYLLAIYGRDIDRTKAI